MRQHPSRSIVEHPLRRQLLEPRVLVLQRRQGTGVGQFHPAKLRLELIEGRCRNAVLAAKVRRIRTENVSGLEDRSIEPTLWIGGRAVDCASLIRRWTFIGLVGSNPALN